MLENDITIIFLTANKVPEKWAEYQKGILLEAVGKSPIITVSYKPLDWGTNIIQTATPSSANIYKQMLRASKMADTEFIGIAEDDVLYPYEHFHSYRPEPDIFAYNQIRWQVHTWQPLFYWRKAISNYSLIAPRKLLIEALEERFAKYPEGRGEGKFGELGRRDSEREMGVTPRNTKEFATDIGMVCVHHKYGLDILEQKEKKKAGYVRALEIPYWGRAEDIVKRFI